MDIAVLLFGRDPWPVFGATIALLVTTLARGNRAPGNPIENERHPYISLAPQPCENKRKPVPSRKISSHFVQSSTGRMGIPAFLAKSTSREAPRDDSQSSRVATPSTCPSIPMSRARQSAQVYRELAP